ncbi:30S ribosomal protein S20 [bacterium]|nr:MAG: 30S ribosomal protein S20 [bacterium]
MPNTQINKSAEKRARQDKRKREKNRIVKGYLRDVMRSIRAEKTPEATDGTLSHFYSVVDKAAKKRVIHKRTAARYKSRIAAHIKKQKEAK